MLSLVCCQGESDMSHCMHRYPQSIFESYALQFQVKSRGR